MQNHNSKFKTYLILSFALLLCAPQDASRHFRFSVFASQVEALPAISKGEPAESVAVKSVCELIYQGQFDTAGELINACLQKHDGSAEPGTERDKQSPSRFLWKLAEIVQEYRCINQQRQLARATAYVEGLAELEKLQAPPSTVRIAEEQTESEGRADADANDIKDANDVTSALSVIAKVCKFADEIQKRELLSEPFVKQTIQNAKSKSAELEAEGKWLDAYVTCYYWLRAIEPENKVYSDYAEHLIEKANIAVSFQDSPCETRKERYENIRKKMFVRAIDALNFNYVISPNYQQMATKAIKRYELLTEVISSSSTVRGALWEAQDDKHNAQHDKKFTAWLAGLAAISDEVNQSLTGISKDKFAGVFEKVLALNATTVELPVPVLIAQFAEASLSALDPYTVMVWPKQVQDFEKMMTNEFTGIGIEILKQKGLLTVVSLLPDTPAYNSGLDAGDVIELVDGVETKDMSLSCAVKNITGPAGTKVRLTIRRPGEDKTRDITITRAKITVPTIRGWQRAEAGKWLYIIDDTNKIGHVRITSFSDKTASDFEKVLTQLEREGLRGLILDLRFNTGGLLDSAVEVADMFLTEGLIVSMRPRFGLWTYASARKKKTHPAYPLVILIDSRSASASEIVAGALADKMHNRAILVGERTHGKGSVQGITHHPEGGAQLRYTMAYYHLPSGQRVESQDAVKKRGREDWGIGPNIEIKLRSDELKKLSEVQRDNNVLVKADHDSSGAPLKKHTVEESLAADPQLAVGIIVIKTKLIEKLAYSNSG